MQVGAGGTTAAAQGKEDASREEERGLVIEEESLTAQEEALQQGDWSVAIAHFTEAIAADPNNGEHYARRSEAYIEAGRFLDAFLDARRGAELGGETAFGTASCHCQLGHALAREGKLQAALEAYERSLTHDSTFMGSQQGVADMKATLERIKGSGSAPVAAEVDDVEAQQLRTLPTPEEILGKGFEVVVLHIGASEIPLRFLLSTTLPEEAVIYPATCGMIGVNVRKRVDLEDVRFQGGASIGSLKNVAVTQFIQAVLAQQALGVTVHGMLGLPFLARYDIDLDRVRSSQRFKAAGSVLAAKQNRNMRNVCGAAVNLSGIKLPSGMIGLPVQVRAPKKKQPQQFLGVLDTSSMFSMMNWKAAQDLGIANGPNDAALKDAVKVVGATPRGPAEMPLVNVKINLCGAPGATKCALNMEGLTQEEFEATGKGKGWSMKLQGVNLSPTVEFGRVNVAIGDALQFAFLADSAVGEFAGGAILVGQDVLAQARRLTLSTKEKNVWVDPPARIVDANPIS